MANGYFMSEVLKGITNGMLQGMQLRQQKEEGIANQKYKNEMLDLQKQGAAREAKYQEFQMGREPGYADFREAYLTKKPGASEIESSTAWENRKEQKATAQQIGGPAPVAIIKDTTSAYTDVAKVEESTKKVRDWVQGFKDKKGIEAKTGIINKIRLSLESMSGIIDQPEAVAKSRYFTELNNYIKQITGAQMSEYEIPRLMAAMPDLKQNPDAFMGVWNDIMSQRLDKYINTVDAYSSRYSGLDFHVRKAGDLMAKKNKILVPLEDKEIKTPKQNDWQKDAGFMSFLDKFQSPTKSSKK